MKMLKFMPIEFIRLLNTSGSLEVPFHPNLLEVPAVGFV